MRGEFPNPKRELLPGQYVRVQIEQGIDSDAIAVPQQAIQRNGGGGSEVFVVKDDNRVAIQPVRIGSLQDGQWFVTDGLKAGDKVVVEGFQKFVRRRHGRAAIWVADAAAEVTPERRRPRKRNGKAMPSFFIDRPIFAWVVALFICLIGAISIPLLAVAQYPIIAPPSISVSTSYPGASPENLYNSVTRLIEEELNGASGILNFESTSDSLGQVEITANFVPGTETGAASVEVQNRLKRVEARLPRAVIQQGILVEEASSAVLQIITLRSTDGSLDEIGLGDFMIRNVLGEISRIPGVGRATLYSTERSLRIWIDPDKLVGYGLTADDVTKAIAAQNAQVASGSIGAEPSTPDQKISALVLVKGQLGSPDEFGSIILRANSDGSTVRLRDVARIEIGGLSYQLNTRLNGQPTAGLSVMLSPTGNALATASAVEAKMKELSKFFPANIAYDIPYNITPVVEGFDRESAVDPGRGRGAGVHRDVPVSAKHPLHHHSDHRGAGGIARHLRDRCCWRAIPSTC